MIYENARPMSEGGAKTLSHELSCPKDTVLSRNCSCHYVHLFAGPDSDDRTVLTWLIMQVRNKEAQRT